MSSDGTGQKKISKNLDRLITTLCVIGMLGSAIIGSFLTKQQYETLMPPAPGKEATTFNHPYMTTVMMFVSEFSSILIWIPEHFVAKKKGKLPPVPEGKKKFKFIPHCFLFMVPTLCDIIASTLVNIAIFFAAQSVTSMVGRSVVVFVAMFSAISFKQYRYKFDLPQGIGLLLIVIGLVIITYATSFMDGGVQGVGARNNGLGIFLSITGCMFTALWCVTEEIFLRRVQVASSLAVTCEGAWGLIYNIVLMPIYEHVKDPFWTPEKGQTEKDRPFMEDCYAWYYQSIHSPKLIALIVAQWILTLIYNVAGCEITNRVAAAARQTFDTIKVIFVWLFSIIFKLEEWSNTASPVRLVGFVILTLGVFLYNNVTQWLPFLKPHNKEIYGPVGTQCKNCCKKKSTASEQEDAVNVADAKTAILNDES